MTTSEKNLYDTALELREKGEFDQAINLLKQGIEKFPKDLNMRVSLSYCYFLNDSLEKSAMHHAEAKAIDPSNASVGWNESRLLLRNKQVAEAVSIAENFNQRFPEDAEGMGVLGACLRAKNDLNKSTFFLDKAIEQNPSYAEALINRGLNRLGKKNITGALEDLEKAHRLKPHIKQIWDLVVSLNTQVGHYSTAISLLINMIEIDPNHEKSFALLAACNHKADSSALAIQSFKKVLEVRPNDVTNLVNFGIALAKQDNLVESTDAFNKAIAIRPDYTEAHYNLGIVLTHLGRLDEAEASYKQTIALRPDYAEAYYSFGNTLQKLGRLEEAEASYREAISLKSELAEAHNNLGITLKKLRRLDEAEVSYEQAIALKPAFAEAHHNLGNAHNEMGKLEKARVSYEQSVAFKPDYAEAHNNLGNTLQGLGRLDKAELSYKRAITLQPDFVEAFWNLHGIQRDIQGAEYWIDQCLMADSTYLEAKFIKSALRFYQGDRTDYENLMQSELKQHPYMRSISWAFNLPNLPALHFNKWYFFDAIVKKSKISRPFYEFGVWRASSFKYLIKIFKKGYGFDTFTGLPEDWDVGSHVERKGTYTSDRNVPNVAGGEFIAGKFEDTLPLFFAKRRPLASVINFDADLYSSTICALNLSKSVIDKDTILIFDEFIINENWEQDEFKALNEFCSIHHYSYEVIAISFFSKQVAVRLLSF